MSRRSEAIVKVPTTAIGPLLVWSNAELSPQALSPTRLFFASNTTADGLQRFHLSPERQAGGPVRNGLAPNHSRELSCWKRNRVHCVCYCTIDSTPLKRMAFFSTVRSKSAAIEHRISSCTPCLSENNCLETVEPLAYNLFVA